MLCTIRKLRSVRIVFLFCVLASFSQTVQADDVSALSERLDALERENRLLKMDLDELRQERSPWHNVSETSAEPPDSSGDAKSNTDAAAAKKNTSSGDAKEGTKAPSVHAKPSSDSSKEKKEDPLSFSAKWNNGFEATTKNKAFKFHVGGRVQFDGVWIQDDTNAFAGPGVGNFTDQDSVDFRRARLRADGTMYETLDWALEFDFVNSINADPTAGAEESNVDHVPAPTDLWMTFRELPVVGNVRVGNMKEPIGFEHLHSSRYLDFLERSYGQDAFYGASNNGFTPGIMAFDNWDEEHGTWSTGFFKNTVNPFAYGIGDGEYAWTSRVTYLPWFEEKGRYLMHLGVAGSMRDPALKNGQQNYRARGSLRNGPGPLTPVIANTRAFTTSQVDFGALEAAIQIDSVLIEAEYICGVNKDSVGNGFSAPAGAALGDVVFSNWYVQALYFLTGEHREYETKSAVFGRVIPHRNYGDGGHLGAWQIGARYNVLDLVDSGVDGGYLEDVTLGLNWFLNPNLKVQTNYCYTIRDAQAGVEHGDYYGVGTRIAWDF
ncbi:MAG: OprO/OprP family phosphate-selective porin [Planctomyces sp.]